MTEKKRWRTVSQNKVAIIKDVYTALALAVVAPSRIEVADESHRLILLIHREM